MCHLPFMAHERQLNAMYENMGSEVVIGCLLYQACQSNLIFLLLTLRRLACFQVKFLHRLNRDRRMESLKHKLSLEKDIHTSTRATSVVLLVNGDKWEGEAIDKEEKLTKAVAKLNENSRYFTELKEA